MRLGKRKILSHQGIGNGIPRSYGWRPEVSPVVTPVPLPDHVILGAPFSGFNEPCVCPRLHEELLMLTPAPHSTEHQCDV